MSKDDAARKQPFYRRRTLRFHCTGCGACCRGGDGHYVFLSRHEAEDICSYLGLSWQWFRHRYLARHPDGGLVLRMEGDACVFLEDARCRIYPKRPLQCRSYPFWPEVVTTEKGWRMEARRCEGIGTGARIPVAVVEEILAGGG